MSDLPPHDNDDPSAGDWLEQAEARALEAGIRLAPQMGWNDRLVEVAIAEAQLNRREAGLVLPQGPRDLVALLSRRHDRLALKALSGVDAKALKVRERIHAAVEARVEAAMQDEAAVRRANGFLALPLNAPLALRLAWESADHLWRWAGDTATDENHYSKRAILSGVLLTTLAARLRGGPDQARDHLTGRIDQVMQFERWKARLPKGGEIGQDFAGWLGRLRYGARDKVSAPIRSAETLPPPAQAAGPTR